MKLQNFLISWIVKPIICCSLCFISVSCNLSDESVLERFHEISYHSKNTWGKNTWFGVPAQQNPNDVWIIQEIMYEVKPDVLVETGTLEGGSALLWALLLREMNPDSRVITVDIDDNTAEASKQKIWKERVTFIHASSTDSKTMDIIREQTQGKKVMVILDSDHSKNHVLNELKLYSPLVPVGSYLIVQDTNVNGHPAFKDHGEGPWEAVHEFMKNNDDFMIDKERERLLFTLHPDGYLKRVK